MRKGHGFGKLTFKHIWMARNFTFIKGKSPLVISAIHDGHYIRNELTGLFSLSAAARLREEDPYTGTWAKISDSRIIVHHSRFEADVNRQREKAVYQTPEDAWGLEVWKTKLPAVIVKRSLKVYDGFYKTAKIYFDDLFSIHKNIIVFDIHSYNYRREGIDIEADPNENPEVNIGTQNMDRELWQPVVNILMDCFRAFNFKGRKLDVRENIKFQGGYFGKWLFGHYEKDICPISIEFKKIFMDEHTGKGFEESINLISNMVQSSIEPVLKALKEIGKEFIHD
jgi:N-formylglutamate amidohydrolase